MWEVMSYGERPYWDMSNQDVSVTLAKQQQQKGFCTLMYIIIGTRR